MQHECEGFEGFGGVISCVLVGKGITSMQDWWVGFEAWRDMGRVSERNEE
jgi:hypothetical protein